MSSVIRYVSFVVIRTCASDCAVYWLAIYEHNVAPENV